MLSTELELGTLHISTRPLPSAPSEASTTFTPDEQQVLISSK